MNIIKEVIEGLQILSRYSDNVFAEHDAIYAGPADPSLVVSKDDQQRLLELNWDTGERGFYEKFV